jgi:hypothetical protein
MIQEEIKNIKKDTQNLDHLLQRSIKNNINKINNIKIKKIEVEVDKKDQEVEVSIDKKDIKVKEIKNINRKINVKNDNKKNKIILELKI